MSPSMQLEWLHSDVGHSYVVLSCSSSPGHGVGRSRLRDQSNSCKCGLEPISGSSRSQAHGNILRGTDRTRGSTNGGDRNTRARVFVCVVCVPARVRARVCVVCVVCDACCFAAAVSHPSVLRTLKALRGRGEAGLSPTETPGHARQRAHGMQPCSQLHEDTMRAILSPPLLAHGAVSSHSECMPPCPPTLPLAPAPCPSPAPPVRASPEARRAHVDDALERLHIGARVPAVRCRHELVDGHHLVA